MSVSDTSSEVVEVTTEIDDVNIEDLQDRQKKIQENIFSLTQPAETPINKKRKALTERSASATRVSRQRTLTSGNLISNGASGNQTSNEVILEIILKEIRSLKTDVNLVKSSVEEMKAELVSKSIPIDNQEVLDKISMDVANIVQNMEKPDDLVEVIAQINAEDTGATVSNVNLPDVIVNWTKLLKSRKFGFFKYLENKGRYDLHEEWLNQETPFIPASYLPKELRYGESPKEYQVRKKRCENEHKSDMDLLAVRRDEGLAEYDSVDSLVKQTIDQFDTSADVKKKSTEEYAVLIIAEEEVSKKRWAKIKKGIEGTPARDRENKIVVADDRVYSKALKKGLDVDAMNMPQRNSHEFDCEWTPAIGKGRNKSRNRSQKNMNDAQSFPATPIQVVPYQHHMQNFPHQSAYQPYAFHQPFFAQQSFFDPNNPPPPLVDMRPKKPEHSSFHGGGPTTRWKSLRSEEAI